MLIRRLAVLTCGLVAVILGYKLFKLGFTMQGELEAGFSGQTSGFSRKGQEQ